MKGVLVVGLAVLALLAGCSRGRKLAKEAEIELARVHMRSISTAVLMWKVKNSGPLSDLQELLQAGPGEEKLLEELPKDPWGRDYRIREMDAPQRFEVFSLGPDGVENTEDDVTPQASGG
jgi:general secretion pathway protein G